VTIPRRVPAAVLLAVALLATGCGGDAAADADAGSPQVALDRVLHDRLPEDVREAGVLTVATDPSYPPASSFGPDGRTVVGFEPDLGAALGELLGVRVEFTPADFNALLPDLAAHRTDLVMSAVTDTVEREQMADFVTYFRAGSTIVVERGNPAGIHDLADLCGDVVAVEDGTVQVDLLARSQAACEGAPIVVRPVPTNDDALLELRTGRAAAVVADYPPAVVATTDARTRSAFQLASDVQYEPGLYGVAVARDRTALRDVVAAGLQRLIDDGVYGDLLERWDVAHGAVRTVTVNGQEPPA